MVDPPFVSFVLEFEHGTHRRHPACARDGRLRLATRRVQVFEYHIVSDMPIDTQDLVRNRRFNEIFQLRNLTCQFITLTYHDSD
ncbi:hypothetical protein [Ancylobacter oerskovii]|uniref:Uncharacterized protein n=1 Tax=Ancylobacter oerskovii TaxID=459519 RepID=A0ABW4YXK8_9HYPH|nr:hypothetical protein [Ancylobacter oerskovii]MBS7542154.1 hypothetical protein [Ancylobacter oerskovii]